MRAKSRKSVEARGLGVEKETPALPVDIYRTLIGLLALVYFAGLHQEWSLYTARDGYLDHDLIREIFWFTRLTLYQPWLPERLHYLFFLSGWLACLGVVLGWRPRVCAFWAWLVGTSHMRWNFPVCYLDDNSMLMGLFWCALLPTGTTLVWWRWPWDWRAWRQSLVLGGVCRVFVANLALAYWVTGLTKLTCSYWRDGIALYCALQLNICQTQGWWGLGSIPVLKFFNYSAVVVECALPLAFLLRPGHVLRLLALVLAIGLHGGIMLTIGVRYANSCWILSWLVVLREDLAVAWGWARSQAVRATRLATRYAVVVVSCIALSMSEGVPGLGDAYGLGFALQWSLGLSQEYHLFDWIDRFNFVVREKSTLDGQPLSRPYPPGLRGFLLQSYLLDMRWMRLPRGQVGQWQRSLKERLALQLARRVQKGEVVLASEVTRVTPDNLNMQRWWEIEVDRFSVFQGKVMRVLP